MPDISMVPMSSSNIDSGGYDEDSATLVVTFNNGKSYSWAMVPKHIYEEFLAAPSPGQFLHGVIEAQFGRGELV